MKKHVGMLLALLIASVLCFPAFAEEEYAFPGAGITFHLPESYQNLEGSILIDGPTDLGESMYLAMTLYMTMTKEEYDAILAKGSLSQEDQVKIGSSVLPLAYFFNIQAGEKAKEDLRTVLDQAFDGEYSLYPVGENEERALFYCMEELEIPFEENYVKEYTSLMENLGELAEAAELYKPISIYDPYIGKKVEFETTDMEGNPVTSEEIFSQADVTLVNIWTSWCHYCIEEMEELSALHESMIEQGGAVIGILQDANEEGALDKAKGILEEKKPAFTSYIVPDNMDDCFFANAFPTSYLVTREGVIVGEPVVGASVPAYRKAMEEYLAGLSKEEVAEEAAEAQEDAAAEGEDASSEEAPAEEVPVAVENDVNQYRIFVQNEEGEPVSDAMVQFCSDDLCMMGKTDESGMASFDNEPGHYTVHILKAPEGYAKDETEYEMLSTYSDLTVVLVKE